MLRKFLVEVSLLKIMIAVHSDDIDESILFYGKLGFSVLMDDIDGAGGRYVRIIHSKLSNFLFNLQHAPHAKLYLNVNLHHPPPPQPVLFSFISDNYLEWKEVLRNGNINVATEINEPWGTWLYFYDPSGNRICITDCDLW